MSYASAHPIRGTRRRRNHGAVHRRLRLVQQIEPDVNINVHFDGDLADASGNTTQTAVTVDDKTKYSKLTSATPDAITQGKCAAARGTVDTGGTLQAMSINVRPANDGKCGGGPGPQPGHGG